MSRTLCILTILTVCTGFSSLTPEQLEFNRISRIRNSDIAIQRFAELAEKSMTYSDMLLELAARSTNNRIYLLNSQQKYAESSEVAKAAIVRFEQHTDPHLRTVVAGLLLNQSSAMKNLGKTAAHLQLLERVISEYQDDENAATQKLVALALLDKVDAHVLVKDDVQARKVFEMFDERYMQSGLYQSFDPKGLSTTCYVEDPCPPYAAGEHLLNPKFFEDRAKWYRNQFSSRSSKIIKPLILNKGAKKN